VILRLYRIKRTGNLLSINVSAKLFIEEIAFFIKAMFISVEIPIKSQSSWGIGFLTFY
jgi:hypothetical protein